MAVRTEAGISPELDTWLFPSPARGEPRAVFLLGEDSLAQLLRPGPFNINPPLLSSRMHATQHNVTQLSATQHNTTQHNTTRTLRLVDGADDHASSAALRRRFFREIHHRNRVDQRDEGRDFDAAASGNKLGRLRRPRT